jgi:hypothetical protein
MKIRSIIAASSLILGSAIAQSGHPLGEVIKGAGDLVSYANLEGLKASAKRSIEDKKRDYFNQIAGQPTNGIVFDVPVYEFNGGHWSAEPVRLGIGETPLKAARTSVRNLIKNGSARRAPPEGYLFSSEKSFMLWVKVGAGNTVVIQTISGPNRKVLYDRIESEAANGQ